VAYGVWGLLQWPVLGRIYNVTDAWGIYWLCFLAPIISWHGLLLHYRGAAGGEVGSRAWFVLPAGVAMLCAVVMVGDLLAGAILSAAGLLLLRRAFTGESPRQMVRGGGLMLLFMIPLPLWALERLSGLLSGLQAAFVPSLLGALTGIGIVESEPGFITNTGHRLVFARECSGAQSLVGLLLCACYFSAAYRHEIRDLPLMLGLALVAAVLLNFMRLTISCLCEITGQSYWTSRQGHELLGMILSFLGVLVIRIVARDVLVQEEQDSEAGGPPPACEPPRSTGEGSM